MRYRALDANGDYTMGKGAAQWLSNSPACVAQAVKTRLGLFSGEWFLNTAEGTPYATEILGRNTLATYDLAIRRRILGTPGVKAIADYASILTPDRRLTVVAILDTIYGQTTVTSAI